MIAAYKARHPCFVLDVLEEFAFGLVVRDACGEFVLEDDCSKQNVGELKKVDSG
ncbi:MAG: hypothetical protein M0T77_10875 [Actinomycetota bacterium]|nr:hypothetical protein [Actinomycetota bacterium]